MKKIGSMKVVEQIITKPKKNMSLIRNIPVNKQGFVLLRLSKHHQEEIMGKLSNKEIIALIRYLDPDEATDLLQNLNERRRKKIVKELRGSIKEKVEFLLRFNPKTAAGIMTLDYIEVNKDLNLKQIAKIVQKHEKNTGKFPAILVVDEGYLLGELPGYMLGLYSKNKRIKNYLKNVPAIRYNKDESEVIDVFKKHLHNKVIVLDEDDSIMGVIYADDMLAVLEKQAANNLRDFAGVSKEEDVLDSAFVKVRHRYKWLILNLATAFLAASVVGLFEKTISAFVLLAVYMPIVAGMGGNAGTQTLAVVVRGLALKEITLETAKNVIYNEAIAGAINGVINGVLVAAAAILWHKSPLLGLAVSVAMVVNLIVAGFFGAVIPLVMKRMGKDPASSATIFITTATDVFGFFVFLGVASLFI